MALELPAPADFADAAKAAIVACSGLGIRDVAERLSGDGLTGVIAPEAIGGLDLSFEYAVPVLTVAGASNLTFPLLETLVASRLLKDQLTAIAADIVAGTSLVTIAWTGMAEAILDGETLIVNGVVSNAIRADECDFALIRLVDGGAILLPLDSVKVEVVTGLDQDRPSSQLLVQAVKVPAEHRLSPEAWNEVEADIWLGFASLLLGGAEACLDMAQEHANTRVQFGKALSANQAIRHQLARQKLQLEAIRNIIRSCFLAEGTADIARHKAAFVVAAENTVAIIERSIQIYGGMGFTWEVPLHRYLRWARALQQQGDSDGVMLSLAGQIINESGVAAA